MGACCQSTVSKPTGEQIWETTPELLLPKKIKSSGNHKKEHAGNIDPDEEEEYDQQYVDDDQEAINQQYKQKNKKTKRKNPDFDPYANTQITQKHENNYFILKMLQEFNPEYVQNGNQNLQDLQQTIEEQEQHQQQVDSYDISTQIHLQNVTNKYANIKNSLKQDQFFIDQEFPHTKDSISKYIEGQMPQADQYQWVKADQCVNISNNYQEMEVFTGGVDPKDIQQGALGDCYFLCSLSALAERQGLIKRLFKTKDLDENGIYAVWLCVNGEWQEVIIDDYFPCQNNKPVFSRSINEELWVLLLEKAYAKVFGGYDKIQAGLTGEALRDLTGAPYKWVPTSKGPQEIWDFIISHDQRGHILTAGSQQIAQVMDEVEGRKEQDMGQGIVSGHAYAILDARTLYTPDEVQLVQLRNPWASFEWKGDWSDKSDLWSHDLKKQLGVTAEDDGIFWMTVQDLCEQFSDITANMLEESDENKYVYNSQHINFNNNNNSKKRRALVKFVCHKPDTKGFIQISQKDARFYNCEPYKNYEYSDVRLYVCKSDFSQYIGDIHLKERDLFVENQFEQATYYAFIEVDWSDNCYETDFLTISSYANEQIIFKDCVILDDDENTIFDKILLCKPPMDQKDIHNYENHNVQRFINQQAGYISFNYYNFTENVILVEDVDMSERLNLDIQPPFQNPYHFKITVKPKEMKIVKFKINNQGNGSFSFAFTYHSDIQMGDSDLIVQIKEQPRTVSQRQAQNPQTGEEDLVDIWAYTYLYSHGLALYWENQSFNTYQERLQIQLTNLEFDNSEDKVIDDQYRRQFQNQNSQIDENGNLQQQQIIETNFVEISLNSGSSRLVKFKVIDPELPISFGTSCNYQIF